MKIPRLFSPILHHDTTSSFHCSINSLNTIDVREVATQRDLAHFIKLPLALYARDPYYVPQLTRDMKVHFSSQNPFLRHARVKFFLARRGGAVVGRIASIINPEHIERHGERAGFFGFFESINDSAVADALLNKVRDALSAEGMEIMRGPMNFSTNEECGFLIEGFDRPPMLMTPYNPPYYNAMVERFGMTKSKDLYAYIYDFEHTLPDKVLRVASLAEKKGVTVRAINMKRFMSDMRVFQDVYNAAWEHNWGFLPLTDAELSYSAQRLKPIVVPDLTFIAEKDGEPVGFLGLIPDFNVVLKQMKGRLTPLSIMKALYYSRKIPSLRLLLYGIKPEYRSRGVDALLFKEGHKNIAIRGSCRQIEFSWILEDNTPVKRIAELFGAALYKRYRIYEKKIT
ncbi:MAG: N-acetyltransferase [Nitrospirota bacterium]